MIELTAITSYVAMGEAAKPHDCNSALRLYRKHFRKEKPECGDHVIEGRKCSLCCVMLLTMPQYHYQRDSEEGKLSCEDCQSPCRAVAELLEAGLL